MAQVSRPFQILLVAAVLLAGVWFVALRPKSSSESTQSGAPQSPPSAQQQAQSAAAPTPTYKGSAPGVAGLSSAVAKAHGAVATSQQNAKQLEANSAKASGEAASPSKPSSTTSAPSSKSTTSPAPSRSATPSSSTAGTGAAATASRQKEVEADLKAGHTSVILFWDPAGSVDRAVHRQVLLLDELHTHRVHVQSGSPAARALQAFAAEIKVPMNVHVASAKEVSSFGTITRGIQVLGTPTTIVLASPGKAVVLTGLTDAYAVQQAIAEAHQG